MRALMTMAAFLTAAPAFADNQAYKPDPGPFAVQTADEVTLRDEKREKDLSVRVYFPQGDGPFLLIVFSHGFGSGLDAFANVSRHWVSHGYVVVHPEHADARHAEKKLELPRLGHSNAASGISNRVRDVTAVLDAVDELEMKLPDLKGKIDPDRIGVGGHSYGACVAMLIGGVTIEANGEPQYFADARVKCILPFSAAGTGEYGLTQSSWKKADLPVLYITGTRDVRPGHGASWRNEPFDLSPPKEKRLLVLKGATHFSFGGGQAKGGRLADGDPYAPIVRTASLAFWDAYLMKADDARAFLQVDGALSKLVGDAAKLSVK